MLPDQSSQPVLCPELILPRRCRSRSRPSRVSPCLGSATHPHWAPVSRSTGELAPASAPEWLVPGHRCFCHQPHRTSIHLLRP